MIDSIGSTSFRPPPPPSNSEQGKLSEEQNAIVEETLSNFDANELTESDALSIAQTFADAGIQPSPAMANKLSELGFDAQEIGELASNEIDKSQHLPPLPPQGSGNLDLGSAVDYLETLFEQKSDNEKDNSGITAKLAERFGLAEGQSLINITV